VINKKLEDRGSFDIDYMKEIQLDYTSEFALTMLPFLLQQNIKEDSQIIKRAMTFLRMWDCVESKDSEATLIFHSIIKELVKNIYYDELTLLGDDYYESFAELKYFVHRKLRELVVHKNSSWVDNIETKNKIETLDEVLTKSIYDGITFVEHKYGPNWSNWKWGDAHSKTHKHMLSKSSLLDKIFGLSVGPFRSGGSDKTPNAGGYRVTKSFKQTAGASMRRIVDFSNMNNTQIILPTGQSGLPNSPNYKDQASLYNSGNYRKTLFNEDSIKVDQSMRVLLLTP
jgi:penicillin amidase